MNLIEELTRQVGPTATHIVRDLVAELERGRRYGQALAKVLEMREAQRKYFQTKDRHLVPHCKKLEADVDRELEALRKPKG